LGKGLAVMAGLVPAISVRREPPRRPRWPPQGRPWRTGEARATVMAGRRARSACQSRRSPRAASFRLPSGRKGSCLRTEMAATRAAMTGWGSPHPCHGRACPCHLGSKGGSFPIGMARTSPAMTGWEAASVTRRRRGRRWTRIVFGSVAPSRLTGPLP
jgi:hypothetical protein